LGHHAAEPLLHSTGWPGGVRSAAGWTTQNSETVL
jgi:hypothetical protein